MVKFPFLRWTSGKEILSRGTEMNKVVIALEAEELLELQRVVIDSDQKGALDFLKTRIIPKIPTKGTAFCDSLRLNPYLRRP